MDERAAVVSATMLTTDAMPMLMPNAPAANVSLKYGARGAVHAPTSACASGNEAIAMAIDLIRDFAFPGAIPREGSVTTLSVGTMYRGGQGMWTSQVG
mgnify:CR=1 FL=1